MKNNHDIGACDLPPTITALEYLIVCFHHSKSRHLVLCKAHRPYIFPKGVGRGQDIPDLHKGAEEKSRARRLSGTMERPARAF